ncbi:MAG: rod shape-determining protein MreC [Clostridia bacterium]|nr:rod shape-determining protein MreC [Clostridia bacterium]
MRSYFNSKFFYIITFLTLAAVIIPTVLCSMGLTPIFRNAVNTALTPLKKLAMDAVTELDGYAAYIHSFDKLKEENAKLKEENALLKEEVHEFRQLEEHYEWISEYLELKMERQDFKFEPANVCGSESGNYSSVYMLDCGSLNGIEKNMPVLSSGVIMGYISDVGLNWSKATSILEDSSSVGVYDERSGVMGVLEGDYLLASDGLCRMSYLEEGADVQVGDRVLTAGYGSVYPRGLTIGYVERVEQSEFSRTTVAYVRPAAFDLTGGDKISKVMVITDYEIYSE